MKCSIRSPCLRLLFDCAEDFFDVAWGLLEWLLDPAHKSRNATLFQEMFLAGLLRAKEKLDTESMLAEEP